MTHSATSPAWHFLLLPYKAIFQKHSSSSSFLRSSISSSHVRSSSISWLARGIDYQGARFRNPPGFTHVRYDAQSDKLYPSVAVFDEPPPLKTRLVLRVLELLRLVRLERTLASSGLKNSTRIVSTTNLTILNFLLVTFGPMHEQTLCSLMAFAQVLGSVLAFGIRYGVGSWFYGGERR